MSETPNLGAAGIFYLLFVGKSVYFVVEPSLARGAWFGSATPATDDLTNLATVREWPTLMAAADIA